MAGVSDPALRLLCRRMGAGLVVTELTSIHSIVAKERQLQKSSQNITNFIEYSEQERPLAVQLFGSDLDALARAARIVEPFFDIIDYNMGCPAPHITQQMAGGALLQEPNLTRRIFQTLVSSVDKPVTLKIRAGVTDASNHLFRDIAPMAQDEGIQMITLHPRTVSQGYSGRAKWDLIAELKRLVRIPVVGNGDITSPEDAAAMISSTGCDYIMIGRGAMGNPFLFEQVSDYLDTGRYRQHSLKERLDVFFEYLEISRNFRIKFASIRQQAMRFIRGAPGASKLRDQITRATNHDKLVTIIKGAYDTS